MGLGLYGFGIGGLGFRIDGFSEVQVFRRGGGGVGGGLRGWHYGFYEGFIGGSGSASNTLGAL